jgi:hypothetical protein
VNFTQMTFVLVTSTCNSYRRETFHSGSLGLEKGQHEVEITRVRVRREYLGEFHPDDLRVSYQSL